MKTTLTFLMGALFGLSICPDASAFTHPGIPLTRTELEAVKAKIQAGEQPWKAGFDKMAADWTSAIDYGPRAPQETVSRNPHVNLSSHWRPDMTAAYNQARMWYFTGNETYARKSREILLNWAKTQKSFTGMEANLDLGDFAVCYAGAADILRGTWKGWSGADTKAVQKLFAEVYWPALGLDGLVIGPTNKGSLSLAAGAAIAVFCDDQTKLNRVIHHLRYTPSTGFLNTLSNGEHGETGRDEGHSYNHILALSFVAKLLWNQGIDAFSYGDNRLLAMGEYYARENLKIPLPFVPMGTSDEYYTTNWSEAGFAANQSAFNFLHSAYVLRQGMDASYMELKRASQPQDMNSFMYLLPSDRSKARPLPAAKFPAYTSVGSGLTSTDIGAAKPAGSSSYDKGIWTVKGAGSEIWTHGADSFHFASMPANGDCTIIAKVESIENNHPNAKAGIMIRSDLKDTPASKMWIALRPVQPGNSTSIIEGYTHGWTNIYGGDNWESFPRKGAGTKGVPRLPYWLKIERVGDVITAYASPDGTSWASLLYGEFKNMPQTVHVGLAVCGSDNGKLNTSTFSHVSITGGSGGVLEIPEAPLALLGSPGLRIPLRWTESFGATSYSVKRSATPGGPYTTITTGLTNPSYLDTTADFGPTWHYVVTASNPAGESPPSPEEKVSPLR